MKRFVEGDCRDQSVLFPERLDDWIAEDNPVRAVDAFVDELDFRALGFQGAEPADTGRPAYHPGTLLKIYIYGYLNRVQSSRRLEREAQRNVELMWLTGRLAPDFKTIADFRRDNGPAIRKVCARFIQLCREMQLFTEGVVAIDGSQVRSKTLKKGSRVILGSRRTTGGRWRISSQLSCHQASIHAERPCRRYSWQLDRRCA